MGMDKSLDLFGSIQFDCDNLIREPFAGAGVVADIDPTRSLVIDS